ncbi:MAG: hypothetical protein ACKO2G_02560 [Verrucomicrobiales bacterium]
MSEASAASSPATRTAFFWLAGCLVTGALLVLLYPDSYQQDGGHHFLFARWAWVHPDLFVGVWQRPACSLFHCVPALLGYDAARFWSAILSTAGAAMTWLTARQLGIAGSWRAIPFYLLQPALFLMWSDVMTEPLCATILSAALLLHVRGHLRSGSAIASFCICARPEGAFIALVWGVMLLTNPAAGKNIIRRGFNSLWLATGLALWILASWAISGDPLYLKNNWPPDWQAGGAAYGKGPFWEYIARFPEIVGPLLMIPVAAGLAIMARKPGLRFIAALFLFTFAIHSMMRVFGWFGSAGYARYFSGFAPCLAIAGCVGWNALAARRPRWIGPRLWATAVVLSFVLNFWYVDGAHWNRDARGVDSLKKHFDQEHAALKIERFVWSQAYMAIAWDRDPWESPPWSGPDKATVIARLRELPPGTLAVWDTKTGGDVHRLEVRDFEEGGFRLLHEETHNLRGWLPAIGIHGWGDVRENTFYLLYKNG